MVKFKIPILVLLCFLVLLSNCKKEEVVEEPEFKTYESDLVNPTSNDLKWFYDGGYEIINGRVELNNVYGLDNLERLSNLIAVSGSFQIKDNESLTTLEGLDNLVYVDGYFYLSNTRLTSLHGLESLQYIGSSLILEHNHYLIDLNGLNGLRYAKELSIGNGFKGNNSLQTLDGIENIDSVGWGGIKATHNLNLSDYCAIKEYLKKQSVNGFEEVRFTTSDNRYNPDVEEIVNGNCAR